MTISKNTYAFCFCFQGDFQAFDIRVGIKKEITFVKDFVDEI
jgi:hypothetical protein